MSENKNLRVVVADDEEMNLFILMKNMNDNGFNACGFGGGLPVWEYLQENAHQVDVVILDKMMDDMCGIEVVKLMKSHPVLRNIPVMVQSGCLDASAAIDAGVDHYITKPYSNQDIIALVGQLAAVKRPEFNAFF